MSKLCYLCLETVTAPAPSMCTENHAPVCSSCIVVYIQHRIEDTSMGQCPTMFCPCTHSGTQKLILNYESWTKCISEQKKMQFKNLANSLLLFLCGGCHCLKSLSLSNATIEQIQSASDKIGSLPAGDYVVKTLNAYCTGQLSLETVFAILTCTILPQFQTLEDKDAWELFRNILLLIKDPERQSNLHLRYLRARPRIWTPCCLKEHCFRCKTKDFHPGKSCDENTAALDASIISCPSCGIFLVKGDGCNSVTCVCGSMFSWSQEMDNTQRAAKFLSDHSQNTTSACIKVLCRELAGNVVNARAWQNRHRVLANHIMLRWWASKYPHCPTQASVISLTECERIESQGFRASEGEIEAKALWESTHCESASRHRSEMDVAFESIFTTMCPLAKERAAFAATLLQGNPYNHRIMAEITEPTPFGLKLCASAKRWAEKHSNEFYNELDHRDIRFAKQFLLLRGHERPRYDCLTSGQLAAPFEWNRELSNGALTFTNGNSTVERVGGVSSYPAAFAPLPSDRCKLTVRIDVCLRGPNWLTLGIIKCGAMPVSSSDGVGRTTNTWGICDDRSNPAGRGRLVASGCEQNSCRKFQQNDIMSVTVDVNEGYQGWCELNLNDAEFVHRFQVPPALSTDYLFAMTFANDHRVTIITDSPLRNFTSHSTLNIDHICLLQALRRVLRKLASNSESQLSTNYIQCIRRQFGEIDAKPEQSSHAAELFSQEFIGLSSKLSTECTEQSLDFTWNMVVATVWHDMQKRQLQLIEKESVSAMTFLMEHGDSAPFIAAAFLGDHFKGTSANALVCGAVVSRQQVMAYVREFADDMHAWYDYNSTLPEPLFGLDKSNIKCRCIPRHKAGNCYK